MQYELLGDTIVKRPALKFYGGAWTRAAWTVSHFPGHVGYLEPCFGAGSVLFHKEPSKLETVSDVDGRIVNFFEVLRSRPCELITAITLTPWAEEEFRNCLATAVDPLEDARRFFFTCWASIRGGPNVGPSDFRWQKKLTRRSSAVSDIARLAHLHQAAARLKNVQILNRDALEVIEAHLGHGTLIYFDPPYLHRTRGNRNGYAFEVDDAWHVEASELLRQHDGPVVISGYRSELYEHLYEANGWRRVEKKQGTNSGGSVVECIWLNPITIAKLNESCT